MVCFMAIGLRCFKWRNSATIVFVPITLWVRLMAAGAADVTLPRLVTAVTALHVGLMGCSPVLSLQGGQRVGGSDVRCRYGFNVAVWRLYPPSDHAGCCTAGGHGVMQRRYGRLPRFSRNGWYYLIVKQRVGPSGSWLVTVDNVVLSTRTWLTTDCYRWL